MFMISRRLDYGLQLLIALAAKNSDQLTPSAQLSEQLTIPLPFLHQIAHTLMQAGLIKASPGPRGGLRINKSPASITVLKIAEVLEGPISMTPCLDCTEDCTRSAFCAAQFMWDDLQNNIVNQLENTTLAMLAEQSLRISKNTVKSDTNSIVPAD